MLIRTYIRTVISPSFRTKTTKNVNVVNKDNDTKLTVNKSNSTEVAVKQTPIKPLLKNPSTSGMSFTFLTKSYSTSATSVDYIPWVFTPHLIQGQKALIDCFHDVKVKNPALHTFLVKECSELVELQEFSPSYIPIDLLTPPISGLVSLGKNYSITKTKACELGCYAYFNEKGSLLYIGSNINYLTRMKNHYSKLKDLNYPFYTEVKAMGGFQYCKWVPLVSFENFAVKYQKEGNTLTPYDHETLKLVTQFKSRCIEQALIDYFNPKLIQISLFYLLAIGVMD